jgi:type II secretory pathway predicted ATPase ExeA/septal ring-binding cell division protein DamX
MRESRKDSQTSEKSLFEEENILEHPFACTKRMEVLSQIKEAVQNGVNLILLTGEQGSGKTVLCRLLEKELAPSCTTVFFSQAVDSFEDVVLSITMQLGLEDEAADESGDIGFVVEQISAFLLRDSRELLIIFDEAENIFLATLERICRMLEQIIGSGARIHILLSGRKTLLENCDQISIGDFQNSYEQQFDLAPLSYAETADYLRNAAVWQSDADVSKVFSDAVIKEIYAHAQGNLGMTSTFGQDALKSPNDDTSFMVLLEGVKEGVDSIGDHPVFVRYAGLIKKFTVYIPWAGVAVCCFLLLFFLFSPGGNENDIGQDANPTEEIETVAVVEDENIHLSERDEMETVESAVTEQPPKEKETAEQGEEKEESPEEVETMVLSEQKPSEQDGGQVQSVVEQIAIEAEPGDAIDETEAIVEGVTAKEMTENEVVEAEDREDSGAGLTSEEGNVVRLRRLDKIKKKIDLSSAPQGMYSKLSRAETGTSRASANSSPADRLYDARLHAGSGWFAREKDAMYTVQLMALTSKDAAKNLKKMLGQVAYRQESGNFYILRKVTAPESIFVFYGEYPSFERARLAQDSLPKFLRDHKPYALSIKRAVAKVTN